jgi:hypothetical protein
MVFDGTGSLVGRGGTDGGGIDGIRGAVYVSTVRILEKLENPDRGLKALPAEIVSGSACPGNAVPSTTRSYTK